MGVRFGTPAPDLHLYSDASRSGWGAHIFDRSVSGVWSEEEKLLHINLLEMKAMFLALQSFQEVIAGCRVTAMCDTSTVVAYINKQGGTVSRSVCLLASQLLRWMESLDIHLDARYLPAVQCSGRYPQSLGVTVNRSVRDEPKREASPILFPCPGSPGSLRGRIVSSLERLGCGRVSTLSSSRKGGGSRQGGPNLSMRRSCSPTFFC